LLEATIAGIRPVDHEAAGAAAVRQEQLTKPRGALGVLEDLSVVLAGIARACPAPIPSPAAVAIFAGDHGVLAQGVSPWPQEVTGQMVANFASGGAAVCVLARQVGATVSVTDVGVAHPVVGEDQGVRVRRIGPGTADLSQGPAMSGAEALAAIEVGIITAQELIAAGNRCLITGDMGIGNTTASAALIAASLGLDPAEVTGRGTGIDDAALAAKIDVIRSALELHGDRLTSPLGMLAAVGGYEHAALVGFLLAGAAAGVPVLLDGVIAGSAALIAERLAPQAASYWIAGHRSVEPGHSHALSALGLRPVVDLDLRLGEGSGAVLALPLVQAAARILAEMATFDSAGVTDKAGLGEDAAPGVPAGVRDDGR
jgi:nicotinate-nucleotide--dimethylbenzimidazole phosphoribosyltransferase